MADADFLTNVYLNLIGITVSTALPLFILRVYKTQDKKREEAVKAAKEAQEKSAQEIKNITTNATREQRDYTLHMMREMENKYELLQKKLTEDIKHEKDVAHKEMMLNVKKQIDDERDELMRRLNEMRSNQEKMIHSLEDRADMVNGNVAAIRADILELQEDIDTIYSNIEQAEGIIEKRTRKRKRTKKRLQINMQAKADEIRKKINT